jgi:hypothetical protein
MHSTHDLRMVKELFPRMVGREVRERHVVMVPPVLWRLMRC